jgi:hypothetical protein
MKAPASKTVIKFEKPTKVSQSAASHNSMLKAKAVRPKSGTGVSKSAARSDEEEMRVLTVATTKTDLSECYEPCSRNETLHESRADESPSRKQFLKKGEKSRKYDPKQAIIKHHQDKKDQLDKGEKHQTLF